MFDLVALDEQVRDGHGTGAVDGDAHGAVAVDVVDGVADQLQVRAAAQDADAGAVVDAQVVGDLQAGDAEPADVGQEDHASAENAPAVEDGLRAGGGPQGDEAADGAAAVGDDQFLVVGAAAKQDPVSRAGEGEGVANGSQGLAGRAGVVVASRGGDV